MQRKLRYRLMQAKLQALKNEVRELYYSFSCQASFPDSGYFYQNKERQLVKANEKLKKIMKKDDYNKFWDYIVKEGERREIEYNTPVVKGRDGNMYSAADMDAAMAFS